MNQPKSILRFILIAVTAVALAPQRAEAEDSITPGSSQSSEISKDGKTETLKDIHGRVTKVTDYTDKTRTKKKVEEEIKEYHKNGRPKKVVRKFYFKKIRTSYFDVVTSELVRVAEEDRYYPEGEYDEETSEQDAEGKPTAKKTEHYKDGKTAKEARAEQKKTERAAQAEEERLKKAREDAEETKKQNAEKEKKIKADAEEWRAKKQKEVKEEEKEAAEEEAYERLMKEKYGKNWWLREDLKPGEKKERSRIQVPSAGGVSFRTGEVQWNLYGLGGSGHGERIVTDTKTVVRTETVSTRETVLVDVPGIPGLVTRDVTTTHEMKVKHTERHTRNAAELQGGFGGAGAEAKVFVTRHIGLGLEGDWLDGERSIGTAMGTVTARFPVGPCAPYVFGGAGVQFGDGTQAVGKLGGGLEHRFSPSTGVFVDAAWMFSEHENAAVFRAGISLIR